MTRLPLALDLAGRLVVVVGGGPVAERKVGSLLAAGAVVRLVAPEATAALRDLAAAGRLTWLARPYQAGDLAGAWLAVAATDQAAVNQTVAAEASAERVWCNVAHPPTAGTCQMLATVDRGGVTMALATEGASPYAARRLRELVEAAVPEEVGGLVELLGELRGEVRGRYATEAERRACYERMWSSPATAQLRAGDRAGARRTLRACLDQ